MEMNANDLVINNILNAMTESLNDEQISKLKNVLYINFSTYNFTKECTELAVPDGRNAKLLNEFGLTKKLEGRSKKTIAQYIRQNRLLLEYLNKNVEDITTKDIRAFMALRQEDKHLSKVTLENMRHYYASFFNWLEDEEYISKSPARKLKSIKQDKIIKKPFSNEEMVKMRDVCRNDVRNLALIEFLSSTGCRVSELSQLNIDDVNFESNSVIVYGKGGKERRVYLTDDCVYFLKKYIYASGRSIFDSNTPLFCAKHKELEYIRLENNGIRAALNLVGAKSGVEKVHPHRFRRTLACRLIKRGVAIQEVMKILGHEKIETTMLYCNVDDENIQMSHRKYA